MKNLFYSLNFRIFCAGVAGGLVLLCLSAAVGYATFAGALLLNLAASALTVALTAISVDLIIKRTNAARTKAVNQLAGLASERIETLLLWGCGRLYGFKMADGLSSMDDTLRHEIDMHLSKRIHDPKAVLAQPELGIFVDSLKEANAKLDTVLQFYVFALSQEILGTALILRELITQTIENATVYQGQERTTKLQQGVPLVLGKYAELKALLA